nr:hypothetical protein [Lactiplantibacillus pentosus]
MVRIINHYTVASIDNGTGYYSLNNLDIVIYYQADTEMMKVIYLGISDGNEQILSEENYAAAYNDTISIAVKDYSSQNYYPDIDEIEVVMGTTSKVVIPYTYVESIVYANMDGSISDFLLNAKGQWKLIEFMDINGNQVSLLATKGTFRTAESMDNTLMDKTSISEDDVETSMNTRYTFKYLDGSQITYQITGNIAVITSDSDVGSTHVHVVVSYDKYGREESYSSVITTKSGKMMEIQASQTTDGELWVDCVTFGKRNNLITVFQSTGTESKVYRLSMGGDTLLVTQGIDQRYTVGSIQYTFKISNGYLMIYETSNGKTTVYKLSSNWKLNNYDLLTMFEEKDSSSKEATLKTNRQSELSNRMFARDKRDNWIVASRGLNNTSSSKNATFWNMPLNQRQSNLMSSGKTDAYKQSKYNSMVTIDRADVLDGELFVASSKKNNSNSVDKKMFLPQLSEPQTNWLVVIGMLLFTGLMLFGGEKHEKHN